MANGLYVFIGLSLGFGAEFWISMANIQIKYSHKLDSTSLKPVPTYKRWRWWLGVFLLVVNIAFNFVSFMFASLNILAPTSALTIVINAILARWYFKEKLTFFGILGSLSIMIGCVLTIVFGVHSQDELTSDSLLIYAKTWKFLLFTSIHGFCVILFGFIGSFFLHENEHLEDEVGGSKREDKVVEMIINNTSETTTSVYTEILSDNLLSKQLEIENNKEKDEYKHIFRCFLLAFSASGCVAWVQFLGKIAADFMFETISGDNQFDSALSFIVYGLLFIMLLFQLFLISEVMRIFDAVLIVPIYNSLQILSSLALSAVYFNNLEAFSIIDCFMFPSGLMLVFVGIAMVSHGQKHASMKNHQSDQKNYIKNLQSHDS
eukprot:460583_1